MAGVGALGNLISQVARAVSDGYFLQGLSESRRKRLLSRMQQHYIVCGYGRIGRQICVDLTDEGAALVVIESNPDALRRAQQAGYMTLQGDATSDEVLLSAGIQRARCILCALPSDAENLSVVISAKELNPSATIVARAVSEEGGTKLARVGADKIVSPYLAGAKRMATLALHPQVVDFFEAASIGRERFYIEEFLLEPGAHDFLLQKSIAEIQLRERTGAFVVAIRRRSNQIVEGPSPDTRLEPGDLLICMGTGEQLRKLTHILLPTNLERR